MACGGALGLCTFEGSSNLMSDDREAKLSGKQNDIELSVD